MCVFMYVLTYTGSASSLKPSEGASLKKTVPK